MLGDWSVAAFISGSADWLFSRHVTDSHILNVFSAILQFAVVTLAIHETVYALGLRKPTNTIQSTWITFFAVWTLSPTAVSKLTNAYYAFHRILYGNKPTEPAKTTDTGK